MSLPLVSVIIPAYNKADYTCRTIESVLKQSYKNIEIIVVDDGSSDNTPSISSIYTQHIKYKRKINGGACSARNEGIRLSVGDFIAFIDCDDLYAPDKIKQSVEYLQNHPEKGFVHTAAEFIDAKDNVVGLYNHPRSLCQTTVKSLMLGNHICNSTVVVRREVLQKAGLFDETIFTPGDWDMWIRYASVAEGGYIPDPLTQYRVVDNYIFNRLEQALREELYVINKCFSVNSMNVITRCMVMSNYYLRFSMCYYLKDQKQQFWNNIRLALRMNILNLKAIGIMIAAIIMPTRLKALLFSRIVRLDQENQ